jgi:hypothetical protein
MLAPSVHEFRVGRKAKVLAIFAMGIVTGSMLVGWSPAPPLMTGSLQGRPEPASDRCRSGHEVSNFVCRNTWMSQHRYSHR